MWRATAEGDAAGLWRELDDYFAGLLAPEDDALRAVEYEGLPRHEVSPLQGQLLHLLAKSVRAESILEIGTLGGYSTVWLARALPAGGRLVTIDRDPRSVAVARANLERANVQ